MYYALLAVTGVFAAARFVVPVTGRVNRKDIYKDLAHLWVGILFGAAYFRPSDDLDFYWWSLPVGLTAVELVAFFTRKKKMLDLSAIADEWAREQVKEMLTNYLDEVISGETLDDVHKRFSEGLRLVSQVTEAMRNFHE